MVCKSLKCCMCTQHVSRCASAACGRRRVSAVESIFFNLPNIHFLPCTPVTSKVRLCVQK